MTIDELWQNLKPLIGKVDNLENKVDRLEPLVGKVDNLEKKVDKLEPLVGKVDNLEKKVDKLEPLVGKVDNLEKEVHEIKECIHEIKDVNMTSMIKLQMETIQEIKETNEKLDKYIQKNEVEHKKFEYEIANLEWKDKIAN